MRKINKNVKYITLMIHPTEHEDYDIVALGDLGLLTEFEKKNKYCQLIKKSKFGGIPILIIDTCDTLRDAKSCIKEYKSLYEKLQNDNQIDNHKETK